MIFPVHLFVVLPIALYTPCTAVCIQTRFAYFPVKALTNFRGLYHPLLILTIFPEVNPLTEYIVPFKTVSFTTVAAEAIAFFLVSFLSPIMYDTISLVADSAAAEEYEATEVLPVVNATTLYTAPPTAAPATPSYHFSPVVTLDTIYVAAPTTAPINAAAAKKHPFPVSSMRIIGEFPQYAYILWCKSSFLSPISLSALRNRHTAGW